MAEPGSVERGPRRARLPRGPQALPRDEVVADQRKRLLAAMIEAIDERGFVACTIADIVERAGVSRRTFYEHFQSKEECLLATYDDLIATLLEDVDITERRDDGPDDGLTRLEAVIRTLFETAIEMPAAARLVCVELAAAGAPGIDRWAQDASRLAEHVSRILNDQAGSPELPQPVARAIIGAVRNILYSRVRRKRTSRALRAELMRVLPDLMRWIGSYVPTPDGVPSRPPSHQRKPLRGGRAPGTLTLAPSWSERRLPPGEHSLPRGFVSHNQRERIFDAIAKRTAADGYPALGLEDIASEAAISLQTFYQHFDSKEDAFLATYEVGHAKAVSAVKGALDLRLDWAENVKLGVQGLLEFLASEPAYAHLACVDILIAYPHFASRLDQANYSYAELIDFRLDDTPSRMPSSVVGEAIVGGVFELLHDSILHGETNSLPALSDHVSYIVLAPLIGAEAAWLAVQA